MYTLAEGGAKREWGCGGWAHHLPPWRSSVWGACCVGCSLAKQSEAVASWKFASLPLGLQADGTPVMWTRQQQQQRQLKQSHWQSTKSTATAVASSQCALLVAWQTCGYSGNNSIFYCSVCITLSQRRQLSTQAIAIKIKTYSSTISSLYVSCMVYCSYYISMHWMPKK